jgi:hypothetical protein
MLAKLKQSVLPLALSLLLAQGPYGWSQLTLGKTAVDGSGNVSFGYAAASGAGSDSTDINLGFSGDLKGYYFNPSFLQFHFDPYYNQSRLNSDFNSISGAKGFNSSMSLFGGSNMPLEINYTKDYNRESQYGLPGWANGFISQGNNESFNVNWGLRLPNLPSLSVAFGTGSGSSQLIGTNSSGSGSSRVFSLGSSYTVLGFSLNGTYSRTHVSETQPMLTDVKKILQESSDQGTIQLSASRQLAQWANFSANMTRSSFTADMAGTPSKQSFDSFGGNLGLSPTAKLHVNLSSTYTTNLSAMFLQTLLPGGTGSSSGSAPLPLVFSISDRSSSYSTYGASTSYRFTSHLRTDFNVQHMTESFSGTTASSSQSENGGLSYGHKLYGGQFSAHGNLMLFSFNGLGHSNSMGYSGGMGYTHNWGEWHHSMDFNYSKANATSGFSTLTNGYGFGFNSGRRVGRWILNAGARVSKNSLAGMSNTTSTGSSYSISLGGKHYAFSGNYSKNDGASIQTANGLQAISAPAAVLLPNMMVLYQGSAYSVAGSYHPNRRLSLVGDYVHTQYNTSSNSALSKNLMTQMDVKSEYQLRLLSISAGFSRVTQAFGTMIGGSPTVSSYYIGISRHFDLF